MRNNINKILDSSMIKHYQQKLLQQKFIGKCKISCRKEIKIRNYNNVKRFLSLTREFIKFLTIEIEQRTIFDSTKKTLQRREIN